MQVAKAWMFRDNLFFILTTEVIYHCQGNDIIKKLWLLNKKGAFH